MIKSIAITTINSILTTILVLLQCVNVAAAQIIPRVEPDTKIYASNPSSQTITVTASYAPMGQNPQNGARQTVTIEPFETVEVPNALSAEGSAYVASSGAEPVLLASVDRAGSGYNAPALPAEAANNRDPQAFILQTGEEKFVTMSGNSTSTNTVTFESRGPEGDGYVSSEKFYVPPNIVTSGYINLALHQVQPPNSSCTSVPQYSDESKVGFVAVYQNPATLDERMQPGQNYVTIAPQEYDITVHNLVRDNGTTYEAYTHPRASIVSKVWEVDDLSLIVGTTAYPCVDNPGGVVDTLNEVVNNYNTKLTTDEQQEFSGDRNGFAEFVNDSDSDGSACDDDEPDKRYIMRVDLTITPK